MGGLIPLPVIKFERFYTYDQAYTLEYRLQCPNDCSHTNLQTIPEILKSDFNPVPDFKYCNICKFALHYDKSQSALVCPVDINHQSSISLTENEAKKKGYRIFDIRDNTPKKIYYKRKNANSRYTLDDLLKEDI